MEAQGDGDLTPVERFFVRNQSNTPVLDPATYALKVWGPGVHDAVSFTYRRPVEGRRHARGTGDRMRGERPRVLLPGRWAGSAGEPVASRWHRRGRVDRRTAGGGPRARPPSETGDRGDARRPRRPARSPAHPDRDRPAAGHPRGDRDERRAAVARSRVPGAHHRAGMGRHREHQVGGRDPRLGPPAVLSLDERALRPEGTGLPDGARSARRGDQDPRGEGSPGAAVPGAGAGGAGDVAWPGLVGPRRHRRG